METTNTDGEMETVAAGGLPLPIDILEGPFFDVLSRLSVKDLHRHTCLSSWRDYFINFPDSRKRLPQTLQGFFYIGDEYRRHSHGGGGDGVVDDVGNGGGDSNSDNASTTAGGSDDTDQDGDGSSKSCSGGGSDTGDDGDGSGSGDDDTEEGGYGSGNSNGGGSGGSDTGEDGDGSGTDEDGDGSGGNSNGDGVSNGSGNDDTEEGGDVSSNGGGSGGSDTGEDGDGSGDGSGTDEDGDGSCGNSNGDGGGDGSGSSNDDTDEGGDVSGNSNGNSSGGSDRDDEEGDGSGGHASKYGLHFLDLLAKSMPIPDDIDTKLSFLPNDAGSRMNLLCSCNGLLLFGCKSLHGSENYHSLGYIVCNPATKQWVRVPSSGWILTHKESRDKYCGKFESTFLFFDPAAVPSRLLLIQFWHDEDAALKRVHIYSSETGKWSDRSVAEWKQSAEGGDDDLGDEYGLTVRSSMGSSFVNGMLHFLVRRMKKNDVLIVAIDGEGSVRRIIHWPLDMFREAVFIGQSQGRLHCIRADFKQEKDEDQRYEKIMSVDVLQDYDAGKWTGKLGIWGSELSGGEECRREDYEVVAFHPDGNLLYIVDLRKGELIQYDMGENYPENEKVLTLGRSSKDVTPYVPCFSRSLALEAPENPAV